MKTTPTTLLHDTLPSEWLTTSQVARLIGCHRNTARTLIAQGEFEGAIQLNRDWRVPLASVMRWIDRRQAKAVQHV